MCLVCSLQVRPRALCALTAAAPGKMHLLLRSSGLGGQKVDMAFQFSLTLEELRWGKPLGGGPCPGEGAQAHGTSKHFLRPPVCSLVFCSQKARARFLGLPLHPPRGTAASSQHLLPRHLQPHGVQLDWELGNRCACWAGRADRCL